MELSLVDLLVESMDLKWGYYSVNTKGNMLVVHLVNQSEWRLVPVRV